MKKEEKVKPAREEMTTFSIAMSAALVSKLREKAYKEDKKLGRMVERIIWKGLRVESDELLMNHVQN